MSMSNRIFTARTIWPMVFDGISAYTRHNTSLAAIIAYLNSHITDKSISPYWHSEESYWHSEASNWHSILLRAQYRLGMMNLKSYRIWLQTVWNQISCTWQSSQEWYFSWTTGVVQSSRIYILITWSVTYAFDAGTIYFWLILEFIVHFDGSFHRFRLSLFSMKLFRGSDLEYFRLNFSEVRNLFIFNGTFRGLDWILLYHVSMWPPWTIYRVE